MRHWLILLLSLTALFADPLPTVVTENDPATLVDGVSVITGDFYLGEEDYVVAGAEPIAIRRFYLSSIGGINQYPHLTAAFILDMNRLIVHEPNGTQVFYSADSSNKIRGPIGDEFYGKEKRPLKYLSSDFAGSSPGVTNTSMGGISAKSQLKNQTIVFDPQVNTKGKSFTLHASDGTRRHYLSCKNQKKSDLGPRGEAYLIYHYRLSSETLPNGRILHYEWDHENRVIGMRTSNPRNTKTLARLPFPKIDPKKLYQSYSLAGSDGRRVSYIYRQTGKKRAEFSELIAPEQAGQSFSYSSKRLSQISLPNGRTVAIQYDGSKVSELLAPIGPNGSLIPYYRFAYDDEAKTSNCVDALGNKTSYFWNQDYRLTRIERLEGDKTGKNSETFVWEGTNLRCKVFYDETGSAVSAKTISYDAKGNILEETFWGNISGQSSPLHIGPDGMPIDDGVEKAVTENVYEARNLLTMQKEPSGLVTEYSYHNDVQLPSSKTVSANGCVFSQTTYIYDDDNTLIREVVEDGSFVRKIQEIVPRQTEPYIGLPDLILEKYSDNGTEKLLKKTKLHYTTGALISQKDAYDAHEVLQYSLHYKYDEKGRVLEETNAIGQRALYNYDEVGNRIYSQGYSCKKETFYQHDLTNRLVQKREKGCDGTKQTVHYAYDEKHNLVSESDVYGNVTTYERDLFGNATQTNAPPQRALGGGYRTAVVRSYYDGMSNLIAHIDAEGNKTHTTYNALGKPTRIVYPDGALLENVYSIDGSLRLQIDPLGVETSTKRDALGRIIEQRTQESLTTFVYDGSLLMETRDAEGTKTHYRYDGAGRKIAEETAGQLITFAYDNLSRVASRIEGDLVTSYQYDLLDRLTEETQSNRAGTLLRIVRYEYDSAGNRTAVIRGRDNIERFAYDSFNRQISRTNQVGSVETKEYRVIQNDLGQNVLQTKITDPLGLQTIEVSDAQQRLSSREKRKETPLLIEQFYYDLNGQKIAQEERVYNLDGRYRSILNQWQYDARGRLQTLMEGNGAKITKYEYDLRGGQTALIKPDGVVLWREYNRQCHLTHLFSSDGSVDHRLQVDLLGRVVGFDGISRALDERGRILEEDFPSGYTIKNRYDKQGRKVAFSIPSFGIDIAYQHGPLDLEQVLFQNNAHVYARFDLAGNVLEETLPSGLGTVYRAYDLVLRPTSLKTPYFGQTIEEYDAVGNIHRCNVDDSPQVYSYDALYQLTSEAGLFCHTYAFDALHNRMSKDGEQYALNALNQTISHCTYDLNGNPTQIGDLKLSYDALDRLIRVETPNATAIFCYDYLNRCLTQTIDGEKPVHFLYDGQNEIGSFDEALRDFRVLGRTKTAEIGAAIALILNGEQYVPIHDLQGNVAALVSLDGNQSARYRYSAFGEEMTHGSALSPWRFVSKRKEPLTGFVNYGRRYYAPTLGTWLTPDPLGLSAGANLYAFLQNNPLTRFDEYGLIDYGQYEKGWNDHSKRVRAAAFHEIGHQTLGVGRFFSSAPYQLERGFNHCTNRQTLSFGSWQQKQCQFFNKTEDWMYRAIPTDRMHADYQMYRSGVGWGLNTASLAAGGYGLFKGGVKAVQWGSNAWKMRRGAYVAGEKLAPSRFHQAASQLSETGQNNIRILRGWAKSKGWEKFPNPQGRPEKWGIYTNGIPEWRVVIKPEGSFRPGLDIGSSVPRFDARIFSDINGKSYINPFTNQVGNSKTGTHLPLEFMY